MTPRLAITPAGTPGEIARAELLGLQCGARRAAPRQLRSNKQIDKQCVMRSANQGLCDTHTPGAERTRPRWGPAGDLASGAQVAGVACGGDWGAIFIFFEHPN